MPEEHEHIAEENVVEKGEELVHKAVTEAPHRPRWLDFLALSTALFAVLTAVAALLAGDSANEALYRSNLATLSQAKASDTWGEFQAESLKKYLHRIHAETLMLLKAPAEQILSAQKEVRRRQSQQDILKEEAQKQDAETKKFLEESQKLLGRHRIFALSLTLFQVAIGLSAIAAILRLRWVWWVSLLTGGLAIAQLLRGLTVPA